MEEVSFKGKPVLRYKDFVLNLSKDQQYDLLVIDGPFGGDYYSRIDILDLIPSKLADSFTIIIDDSSREGEKNTINLIKKQLEQNGIKYVEGVYACIKSTTVIASYDMRFLCSL